MFVAAMRRSSWFGCSSQARWITASAPANAPVSATTLEGSATSIPCQVTRS
jgi:hypothetical protein